VTQLKFRPPCDQCRGLAFRDGHPCKICNGKGFTIETGRTHRGYSESDIVTSRVTVDSYDDFLDRITEGEREYQRVKLRRWLLAMVVCAAFWCLVAFVTWMILRGQS
jgi:hypothetical protein